MASPLNVIRIHGAGPLDDIFEITLDTGEHVCWNVTTLNAAAKAGAFGAVRYARMADLPPARWDTWGPEDRATVDWLKAHPKEAFEPVILIAHSNPDWLALCIVDGQHRLTALQERNVPEFSFYLVPVELERQFRVTGFDALKQMGEGK